MLALDVAEDDFEFEDVLNFLESPETEITFKNDRPDLRITELNNFIKLEARRQSVKFFNGEVKNRREATSDHNCIAESASSGDNEEGSSHSHLSEPRSRCFHCITRALRSDQSSRLPCIYATVLSVFNNRFCIMQVLDDLSYYYYRFGRSVNPLIMTLDRTNLIATFQAYKYGTFLFGSTNRRFHRSYNNLGEATRDALIMTARMKSLTEFCIAHKFEFLGAVYSVYLAVSYFAWRGSSFSKEVAEMPIRILNTDGKMVHVDPELYHERLKAEMIPDLNGEVQWANLENDMAASWFNRVYRKGWNSLFKKMESRGHLGWATLCGFSINIENEIQNSVHEVMCLRYVFREQVEADFQSILDGDTTIMVSRRFYQNEIRREREGTPTKDEQSDRVCINVEGVIMKGGKRVRSQKTTLLEKSTRVKFELGIVDSLRGMISVKFASNSTI